MRLIETLSLFAFAVTSFAQFQGEGVYTITSVQYPGRSITASPADDSVIFSNKNATDPSQQWTISINRNTSEGINTYNFVNVKKQSGNGYLTLTRLNEKLFASTTSKYKGDTFKTQQGVDRLDTFFTSYDYVYVRALDETVVGGISTINGIPNNSSVKFAFEKVQTSTPSSSSPTKN